MPRVRLCCGSSEDRPLGWIHNLDQEKAAPREVVEDHDNEGLVEAKGERLRCHVLGDFNGSSFLHTLLIKLQHGLMDHLLGWTKAGG